MAAGLPDPLSVEGLVGIATVPASALRGDRRKTLDYLQEDAANGGLSSVAALKSWPHFDGLRDDPEFQALIAKQDEINARRYRHLKEEGLLLGPEEVLARGNFDCAPFVEGSESSAKAVHSGN